MVESAQRRQIVQCMGVSLTFLPRDNVVDVQVPRRAALHAAMTVTSKGSFSIAEPAMRAPTVRVRLHTPRRGRRALNVLPLPSPVARHRTERTTLLRPVLLVRLAKERLPALSARQFHLRPASIVTARPRAELRRARRPIVHRFERLVTLLALALNRSLPRHVPAPSIGLSPSLPATMPCIPRRCVSGRSRRCARRRCAPCAGHHRNGSWRAVTTSRRGLVAER